MTGFDWLKRVRAALGLSPRRPAPYRRPPIRLFAERLEDRTGPALNVVSASPAPEWTAAPLTTLDLTFDAAVNPASVQAGDLLLLRNNSSFGSVTAAQVVPGTNDRTVRFTISGVATAGQLTTHMRPGLIASADDS